MLTLPAVILIALGLLLCVVGGIWGIVVAFRRSVLWGICYLFVPFAALVFLFVAWADAKRPLLVKVIGLLMMAGVLLLPNQGGLGLLKKLPIELEQLAPFQAAVPEAVVRVSVQERLADLATREQSLRARKTALDTQDLAAARALTDDILKYNADLKAATDKQAALQTGGASVVSNNPVPK